MPFGASISCALYQKFSNALKHIITYKAGGGDRATTNYLDDFLFISLFKVMCNYMIDQFMLLCHDLHIPVAVEKTEWATTLIIFLGILLDVVNMTLSIPLEKQQKALNLLKGSLAKKKATIKELQVLTGYLNFLTKAIFPGRIFTRRMYAKYANLKNVRVGAKLKPHHHVRLDGEFKFDCEIWRIFLSYHKDVVVCRPMVGLNVWLSAQELKFWSDASANAKLGFAAVFNDKWLFQQWDPNFIKDNSPSIEYLELFGLTAGLLTWGHLLRNCRIIIFCDNTAVVGMVDNLASSCKNCMYLLRLLTLNNLTNNRRVFVKYIDTKSNYLADSLSRLQFKRFWRLAPPGMEPNPTATSELIWPASHIWLK